MCSCAGNIGATMGRASAALLDAYPSAALTLLEPDEGRLALVALCSTGLAC